VNPRIGGKRDRASSRRASSRATGFGPSLEAKSLDRVQSRGLLGRVEAEGDPHQCAESHRDQDRSRADDRRPVELAGEQRRDPDADAHSDEAVRPPDATV